MLWLTKWLWAALKKMHFIDWSCCFSWNVSAVLMASFIVNYIWFTNPFSNSFLLSRTEQSISMKRNSFSQRHKHKLTTVKCGPTLVISKVHFLISSYSLIYPDILLILCVIPPFCPDRLYFWICSCKTAIHFTFISCSFFILINKK